jgi:hypothetical protein
MTMNHQILRYSACSLSNFMSPCQTLTLSTTTSHVCLPSRLCGNMSPGSLRFNCSMFFICKVAETQAKGPLSRWCLAIAFQDMGGQGGFPFPMQACHAEVTVTPYHHSGFKACKSCELILWLGLPGLPSSCGFEIHSLHSFFVGSGVRDQNVCVKYAKDVFACRPFHWTDLRNVCMCIYKQSFVHIYLYTCYILIYILTHIHILETKSSQRVPIHVPPHRVFLALPHFIFVCPLLLLTALVQSMIRLPNSSYPTRKNSWQDMWV